MILTKRAQRKAHTHKLYDEIQKFNSIRLKINCIKILSEFAMKKGKEKSNYFCIEKKRIKHVIHNSLKLWCKKAKMILKNRIQENLSRKYERARYLKMYWKLWQGLFLERITSVSKHMKAQKYHEKKMAKKSLMIWNIWANNHLWTSKYL